MGGILPLRRKADGFHVTSGAPFGNPKVSSTPTLGALRRILCCNSWFKSHLPKAKRPFDLFSGSSWQVRSTSVGTKASSQSDAPPTTPACPCLNVPKPLCTESMAAHKHFLDPAFSGSTTEGAHAGGRGQWWGHRWRHGRRRCLKSRVARGGLPPFVGLVWASGLPKRKGAKDMATDCKTRPDFLFREAQSV